MTCITSGTDTDLAYRQTLGSAQAWADSVGDSSFTFDKILPFYKKSVTFTPPDLAKIGPGFPPGYFDYDSNAFGAGGPLNVTYANYQQPYGISLAQGFSNIGLKKINGLNSGELIGYAPLTVAVDNRDATRSSSETSFLRLALETTPLLVYQQTLARKIIFDSTKRATGVVVETVGADGVLYTLSATKEVISSAGAVRSPIPITKVTLLIRPQSFGHPNFSWFRGLAPLQHLRVLVSMLSQTYQALAKGYL